MHKVDCSGHKNYEFVEEDINQGESGTHMCAEYFNMLQLELINVLNEGNITPDKPQTDQLAQAIRAIVDQGEPPLGVGQVFADTTGYTPDTLFTNTTGRSILIYMQVRLHGQAGGSDAYLELNGIRIAQVDADGESTVNNLVFLVPDGANWQLRLGTVIDDGQTWDTETPILFNVQILS